MLQPYGAPVPARTGRDVAGGHGEVVEAVYRRSCRHRRFIAFSLSELYAERMGGRVSAYQAGLASGRSE